MKRILRMRKVLLWPFAVLSLVALAWGIVESIHISEIVNRQKYDLAVKHAHYIVQRMNWESDHGLWEYRRQVAASRWENFSEPEPLPPPPFIDWNPRDSGPLYFASTVGYFIGFWVLLRMWLLYYDHGWSGLTCKGRLGEGTRPLFIAMSIPFFLLLLVPGVIFWLAVWGCLWIRDGYVLDSNKGGQQSYASIRTPAPAAPKNLVNPTLGRHT